MPKRIRIIPRLDVKGPNLVKGIHFEGLRVLGPPEYFANQYYLDGADELLYMDIVASLYGRNNLRNIVERTARNVFIPITVGGGIRSVDDIREILRAGADKVAINTAAIQRPQLITEGARVFGSQCIVVSIEAKQMPDGRYEAFCDNGRQETGVEVFAWARHAAELGAGELLVTSIDREGTGDGYDLDLIESVAEAVSIPVIACGGAGQLDHIQELVRRTNVSAVAAASIFHYGKLSAQISQQTFEEGNIEFLKKFTQSSHYQLKRFKALSISDVKTQLERSGLAEIRSIPRTSVSGAGTAVADSASAAASKRSPLVVVVDYGCGNLFSIEYALREIGARFEISAEPTALARAGRVILPGVGAFGDGMRALTERRLVEPLLDYVGRGQPLLGICLGMQLLLTESEEFGRHAGLDVIKGRVVRFSGGAGPQGVLRIPHIGWSEIAAAPGSPTWEGTILEGLPPSSSMYFVHSYVAVPDDAGCVLAQSEYAHQEFCCVVRAGEVHGCQFHPERSGAVGLEIYRRFIFGSADAAVVQANSGDVNELIRR